MVPLASLMNVLIRFASLLSRVSYLKSVKTVEDGTFEMSGCRRDRESQNEFCLKSERLGYKPDLFLVRQNNCYFAKGIDSQHD
jgi:hypothetical protein